MNIGNTKVWTKTLTNETLTINAADNVLRISWQCSSGNTSVIGDLKFRGLAGNAITNGVGEGGTILAPAISNPIDGLSITAAGGSTDVMLTVQ